MYKIDVKESVNFLYRESYPISSLCILSLKYHKEKNQLTFRYLNTLFDLCHDSNTTEYTWFLLYRLVYESPITKTNIKLNNIEIYN